MTVQCSLIHFLSRQRHWWWVDLGWRIRGWISSQPEARSTLHSQHGERWSQHERLSVFHYCRAYGRQSHFVFWVFDRAGSAYVGEYYFIASIFFQPWLDNKHTVFGRVVRGMETCQNISNVRTNSKSDKPHEDIKIVSVTIKWGSCICSLKLAF